MFLPTLPQGLAGAFDQQLREESFYLEAVVPDLGNPLQRNLFADWCP
jgi:hypothetical protein